MGQNPNFFPKIRFEGFPLNAYTRTILSSNVGRKDQINHTELTATNLIEYNKSSDIAIKEAVNTQQKMFEDRTKVY